MTTAIEDQCRTMLRLFPQEWRNQHGEALIGTLIDSAEATQRSRMSLAERVDLAAGAFDAHLAIMFSDRWRAVVSTTTAGLTTALFLASCSFDLARHWLDPHLAASDTAALGIVHSLAGIAMTLTWLLLVIGAARQSRRLVAFGLVGFFTLATLDILAAATTHAWMFADPTSVVLIAAATLLLLAGRPHALTTTIIAVVGAAGFAAGTDVLPATAFPQSDGLRTRLFQSLHSYVWGGVLNPGNLAAILAGLALVILVLGLIHQKNAANAMILSLFPIVVVLIAECVAAQTPLAWGSTALIFVALLTLGAARRLRRPALPVGHLSS